MTLKLALPKGPIQTKTASFLEKAGFDYTNYHESSRSYRPKSQTFPKLFSKLFHEKDIAVQVAIGNYDLAICGLDWVQELLVKYHSDAIVKVRDLGYGRRGLYAVTSRFSNFHSVEEVKASLSVIRIVSEYPNLAEAFALRLRLRNFKIMPVWGAAEVYPPEHAEIALISASSPGELQDLVPIAEILTGNAWLIANKNSIEQKDIGSMLAPFYNAKPEGEIENRLSISEINSQEEFASLNLNANGVSLALADGHQQSHTRKLIKNAGFRIKGYSESLPTRRPVLDFDGVTTKVIRPQDMPMQVANGSFDLAITGRDWLRNQLYQFTSSPVEELLDLGFGWVRIVAVVHNNMPADSTAGLRRLLEAGEIKTLRIGSEYTNIADKYARDNHLSPYKVIPTWGASEAFLPEDADVLIENTETGRTLAKNNLKIIETLFESTGCLIGNSASLADPSKQERINSLREMFKEGLRSGIEGISKEYS